MSSFFGRVFRAASPAMGTAVRFKNGTSVPESNPNFEKSFPVTSQHIFLNAVFRSRRRTLNHAGTNEFKIQITKELLHAGKLFSEGRLTESDLIGVISSEDMALFKSDLQHGIGLQKHCARVPTEMRDLYDKETGRPLQLSKQPVSLIDFSVYKDIRRLNRGQEVLVVGFNPRLLDKLRSDVIVDYVDSDVGVVAAAHQQLAAIGWKRQPGVFSDFYTGSGGGKIHVIHADIESIFDLGSRYDFIADTNAALIYHHQPKEILRRYLVSLNHGGKIIFAATDRFDIRAQEGNPLKLHDLNDIDGSKKLVGLSLSDEFIVGPSQKRTLYSTSCLIDQAQDVTLEDVSRQISNDSVKEANLGLRQFNVEVKKNNGQHDALPPLPIGETAV
jgi:SAM-dependent methyltransferase